MSGEGSPQRTALSISGAPQSTNLSWVYGPFVQTLGIRLIAGQAVHRRGECPAPGCVVVNQRLAQRFWPGQDALGKRLKWGADSPQNRNPWLTIVGVVADVADGALGSEPYLHAYEPFSQFPDDVLQRPGRIRTSSQARRPHHC